MNFAERFDQLAAELQAHGAIHIFRLHKGAPASPRALADAEAAAGRSLPPDVRALYAAHDGYSLAWQLAPSAERKLSFQSGPIDPFESAEFFRRPDGMIAILPLADTFRDWMEHANFSSSDYDRVFECRSPWPDEDEPDWEEREEQLRRRTRLFIFDAYFFFKMAGLVFGPADDAPATVLIGDDHGATFTDFRPANLASYLDLVIRSRGAILERVAPLHGKCSIGQLFRLQGDATTPPLGDVLNAIRAEREPHDFA